MNLRTVTLLIPALFALQLNAQVPAPRTMRGTVNLTIGGANDDRAEYEFTYITGLAFDGKGQIFVADGGAHRIRAYSASGAYLFSMGQKGAGPGDFSSPSSINLARDGKLWVRDNGNHRFSVINAIPPAGKPERVIPFLTNDQLGDRVHWDAAGHVVEVTHASNTIPGQPFRALRKFLDDRGVVVATDTVPPESKDSVESWVFRANGGSTTYNKPFGARRLTAYGDGGYAAYATNTNYAVRLVDANGKEIALLKRPVNSVQLSPADEATVTAALENIAKQRKVTVSSLDFDKPKYKPAIASLQFDMDGRLWVEHSVAAGQLHEADVYARDGKWAAVMQWPSDVNLWLGAVKGNVGVGTSADADGVQRVVRLQWR